MSLSLSQCLMLLLVLLVAGVSVLNTVSVRGTPGEGAHVVEVWLKWSLGQGSTLYRQRFRSRWVALLSLRYRAWLLDVVLPTHWVGEDYYGRRCVYPHEYGIAYGLRSPTADECEHGVAGFWSPALPGCSGFSGEHASAHPLVTETSDGIKI